MLKLMNICKVPDDEGMNRGDRVERLKLIAGDLGDEVE